jgi:hypothetical protein
VSFLPSKLVTLGDRVLLGVSLKSHHPFLIILITFHALSILFPHLLGFSGVLTQEGIVPNFMGRRAEGLRGNVAGKI